jgi:hypothetical protein
MQTAILAFLIALTPDGSLVSKVVGIFPDVPSCQKAEAAWAKENPPPPGYTLAAVCVPAVVTPAPKPPIT